MKFFEFITFPGSEGYEGSIALQPGHFRARIAGCSAAEAQVLAFADHHRPRHVLLPKTKSNLNLNAKLCKCMQILNGFDVLPPHR